MNPYETPIAKSEDNPQGTILALGRPCSACGSQNTTKDSILRSRPSILFVLLFGWLFLLIRGAFAMRTSQCRDCGEVSRYKSAGSWVAMGILIILSLLVVLAIFDGNNQGL
jgi:hypothetical protein